MWHLNCIRFCPTYPLLFHSGIFKASMADFTNQCACILSVLSASPLDRYRPWRSFWQCFHKSRQLYCRRVFNILFPSKICSDISSASDRTFCQFLPAFWRHAGFLLSVRICWIPSLSRHKKNLNHYGRCKNYRILPTRYASSFCSSSDMASKGNMEDIKEYLQTVQSDLDAITPVRFCENETVNLICPLLPPKRNSRKSGWHRCKATGLLPFQRHRALLPLVKHPGKCHTCIKANNRHQ